MPRSAKTYSAIIGIAAVAAVTAIVFVMPMIPALSQQSHLQQKSSLKVAVVTDALFSDMGWGESSLNAAKQIERKYGFDVAMQDNVEIPDIELTLKKYADAGYDLIIAHGVQWGEPALSVGKQYPNVKIVVFTGLVKSENVASIFPMQQEGSFLLGAIAGMMTKTNVIGYVGGEEYPNVINIFEGYKQGAKTVSPDIQVIGTYLNDWDNPAKGKEAATSIIRQKADFVFHVADTSGQGVIQAAKDGGVYALGAVQDQNSLAPNTVLSSFILDVDKAYDQAVDSVMKGTFKGEIHKAGIETGKGAPGDGIVYLAPFHGLKDKVPENVNARLKQLLADILEKRLAVPERLEESVSITS
ncbi:putative ABC-type transport system, periplasmic component/surface lipoprotein [Candidatus Nitrososphaera evergladensis SR1]|uniref:Putative ABC-type transport system, periplasmic component/surface lipoprotein n=1 Tax=Candidatus Nitrososphaera evergladensis SR1 TaxID=1459636 RepID=A0A075MTT7_9ARCH|nr:BMP family protein [Candidatus Nitrososphaera evergladensis]AIF84177.1 putative ABC-type transport system, periplasmic component/surface lipoprotein [Candidatus Nitrososphaera evergladensis SR1]